MRFDRELVQDQNALEGQVLFFSPTNEFAYFWIPMYNLRAQFRGSYPNVRSCPNDTRSEFAFIGRSNVGKSSLINMLVGMKELAHTSKKPGKTQLINSFLIEDRWFLVDLPGYGYARRSKTQRKAWMKMIRDYLVQRPNLLCTFVLIDSNIPPQQKDIDFINWLGEMRLPFVVAYTKADRIKPAELEANLQAIEKALLAYWESLPQRFVTSSVKGRGREEILAFIEKIVAEAAEASQQPPQA